MAGLEPMLEAQGLEVHDQGNLNGPGNPNSSSQEGYRHLSEVVAWNQLVHTAVYAELQAGRLYIPPYLVAMVYVGLDDKKKAFTWLDRAYAERSQFVTRLAVDPIWDSLRRDPRYANLLSRMRLPQ